MTATPPPENPTDTPLLRVVTELERQGFDGQFAAVEGGDVRCLTCRETTPASEVWADEVTRLEGVSDPDDMVMVVPLACPHCSTKGALVLSYGPEASAADSDVVATLARRPNEARDARPTPGVDGGPGPG